MPRFKLTIEYHGGPFRGWQRQENGASVQQTIEEAFFKLGERGEEQDQPPLVYGAGRTDAGVHALAMTAHVDLAKPWDPFRLAEALNFHLKPAPIAILRAELAASRTEEERTRALAALTAALQALKALQDDRQRPPNG